MVMMKSINVQIFCRQKKLYLHKFSSTTTTISYIVPRKFYKDKYMQMRKKITIIKEHSHLEIHS